MKKILILLSMLLGLGLEAATITNWGTQFPNAAPNSGDIILMQQGGVNYYFTPAQFAAFVLTNASTAPHGLTVTASYVNGSYTNTANDGLILMPNGSARTNRLLDSSLYTRPVTIVDSGRTASRTNIWIATSSGQTINGGPTQTNINFDGDAVRLFPTSTGWWVDIVNAPGQIGSPDTNNLPAFMNFGTNVPSSRLMAFQTLDQRTYGDFSFNLGSFVNIDGTNSNSVMQWGYNLDPNGANFDSRDTAIGFGLEGNFDIGDTEYTEVHIYFVNKLGQQYRPLSYRINKNNTNDWFLGLYANTTAFYNPATSNAYFTILPNQLIFLGDGYTNGLSILGAGSNVQLGKSGSGPAYLDLSPGWSQVVLPGANFTTSGTTHSLPLTLLGAGIGIYGDKMLLRNSAGSATGGDWDATTGNLRVGSYIASFSNASLAFVTGLLKTNLFLASAGNIGMGTLSPAAGSSLDVTGTVYAAAGIFTNCNRFVPSLVAGSGGALTNFTLMPYREQWINGQTNVSLRAIMGVDAALVDCINLTITNGSGTDRTLEFSAVTNRYRFSGVYGTNAPNTLTNNTALLLKMRALNTNTVVEYSYFPWP